MLISLELFVPELSIYQDVTQYVLTALTGFTKIAGRLNAGYVHIK